MDSGKQKQIKYSGSPRKGEPEYLLAGKLRKTHGLNGEMYFEIMTDFPQVFERNTEVFVGENKQKMRIDSIKEAGSLGLIRFENYSSPESARVLVNKYIFIKTESLPKPDIGYYYHHDLIGMQVVNTDGTLLGIISEILETGANDVYVMLESGTGLEILIPAIKSVVLKIDIESQKMTVKLPEWD